RFRSAGKGDGPLLPNRRSTPANGLARPLGDDRPSRSGSRSFQKRNPSPPLCLSPAHQRVRQTPEPRAAFPRSERTVHAMAPPPPTTSRPALSRRSNRCLVACPSLPFQPSRRSSTILSLLHFGREFCTSVVPDCQIDGQLTPRDARNRRIRRGDFPRTGSEPRQRGAP